MSLWAPLSREKLAYVGKEEPLFSTLGLVPVWAWDGRTHAVT